MLQPMELQKVGDDLVTEQQQQEMLGWGWTGVYKSKLSFGQRLLGDKRASLVNTCRKNIPGRVASRVGP